MRSKLPRGVDVADLRPCNCCGKPLVKREGEPPQLNVYRLTIDSLILDQGATQQLSVLATMFGGSASAFGIATALSPDNELLKCFGQDVLLVCWWCYIERPLAEIAEAARARREEAERSVAQADGDAGESVPA